tara:strand:+ start:124 stop:744 length:621 start_codon:yes stop_codon:yes gene_type:complete
MKYRTNTRITEDESIQIKKMYNDGMRVCDIARKLNKATDSVSYHTWSKEKKENYLNERKAYKRSTNRKAQDLAYLNTEGGFMIRKYNDVKKSCKRKQNRPINANKKIELLSQEKFLELWTEHKAKQGITCGYTGEPLVMERKPAPKVGRNKVPKNQLSVDCLDPDIGYTKENIVFCSWAFNDRKNAVKIKDCHLIIKKHQERNNNG